MSIDDIASRRVTSAKRPLRQYERVAEEGRSAEVRGEELTMKDGSVWFHPYSGSPDPWQIKP